MAKKLVRPPLPVTSGQGDSDLARPTRTPDAEIDALLDEAGVGVDIPAPAAEETPTTTSEETPAAREGAPTPENPVTGTKSALANATPETPADPVATTSPAAPKAPADPKAPAAPVAPTAPVAPAAPAAPVAPKIADPEVDGLKEPVGASTEAKENFKKLREIATQRKAEVLGFKAKYEEAVDHINKLYKAQGQLPEPVQKELTALREHKRRFDIRNDQEFKTKFDDKVTSNSTEIMDMLKRGGMPEENINKLKGNIEKQPMKWWMEQVIKPLLDSDNIEDNKLAVAIEGKVKDNIRLATEKEEAITNASKEGSQWEKEREEQVTKQKNEENTIMRTTLEELQKTVPWGQLQSIPADATPEVRARLERENAMYKRGEELLPVILNPQNPTQKIEAAALAILSFWQRDEIEIMSKEREKMASDHMQIMTAMDTKIKALEEDNAKLRSAGKTNRVGATPPVTPKSGNSSDNIGMKSDAAFEKLAAEMGI